MRSTAEEVLACDGYKLGHKDQYPDHTEVVQSNWTARGSRVPKQDWVCWFGFQHFGQKFLTDWMRTFFSGNIDDIVADYVNEVNAYLGTNTVTGDHIRDLHALGFLPLEFKCLPEGARVGLRVPMFIVENTLPDPKWSWLVNYLETLLSCELWAPCTSATTALRFREMLEGWARLTGSPLEFVPWQGHDFSMRGMMGLDAAKLSGMGHLVAFTGTDTVPAIREVRTYYDTPEGYLIGGSVNATEHSVMCAGGKDGEYATYDRLLTKFPEGILSVVSDTWDLWNVLTVILPQLREKIMARNGKLVIRPDSGDPVKIIAGSAYPVSALTMKELQHAKDAGYNYVRLGEKFYGLNHGSTVVKRPDDVEPTPAMRGVIELLWDLFGGTTTATGHRLLDSHIGCIYGDGISFERGEAILSALAAKGFASANKVFGLGSYTYQYVTRDTYNFAMKATWVQIAGEGMPIYKRPITDDGLKNSAKGRLAVLRNAQGEYVAIEDATPEQEAASELRSTWKNGHFMRRVTFDEVRTRALGA
jgi:nicotinamide phosphoribosyltransferase